MINMQFIEKIKKYNNVNTHYQNTQNKLMAYSPLDNLYGRIDLLENPVLIKQNQILVNSKHFLNPQNYLEKRNCNELSKFKRRWLQDNKKFFLP